MSKDINGVEIKAGQKVSFITWNTLVGKENGTIVEHKNELIIVKGNKKAVRISSVGELEVKDNA